MSTISKHTGITDVTIGYWKKKIGEEMTHVSYGSTTRNDIRTKCLAVRDFRERNISKEHLAERYHVSKPTITAWINRYSGDYVSHIDSLPDGVTTLAVEERLIFGDSNIEKVRELLLSHQDELRNMIQQMQKYGIMANAVKQAKNQSQENDEKLDILSKAKDILDNK